jgi:hypothetical protein
MTTTRHESEVRADRVAAWATGVGAGLVVFMGSWLVWNRVLTMFLEAPMGPVAAMTVAILTGAAVTVRQGRRLSARFRD